MGILNVNLCAKHSLKVGNCLRAAVFVVWLCITNHIFIKNTRWRLKIVLSRTAVTFTPPISRVQL